MLRIAMVGVGWAGTRQVQAARELGRKVEVVCLVDNDASFLAAKGHELGITRTYTDYRDALADPGVDAVSICLPHHLHHPVALDAAAARKHVLVEKPIAVTVEEASEMLDAARAHDVKLYVAESAVYTAMARTLREIVAEGTHIGALTFASVVAGFRAPDYGYEGRRAWLSTPELGGSGTWLLHGIHTVGEMRYILGEVEAVIMREHKGSSFRRRDLEGTMSGLLTLTSGVHVTLVQSAETRLKGALGGYTLHGELGSLRAWDGGYRVYGDDYDGTQEPKLRAYPEQTLSSYAMELEAFADYVAGAAEGGHEGWAHLRWATTGESERRSLAVVQAGYESARSGETVRLQERFGAL